MNRATSVYLDLVRLLTALVVVMVHARFERFTSGWLMGFRSAGNDAVMVFFVLSGFVIAYCARFKERQIGDYALSRFSRLYSVVLPALAVTIVLDFAGARFNPELYATHAEMDQPFYRLIMNALFLNQIWFLSVGPFSNNPFWSICYEFWYYAVFAAAHFLSGWRRCFGVALTMAIAGPKVLLLMPVWLLGVFAFRICQAERLPSALGLPLFVGSVMVYVIYRELEGPRILLWYTLKLIGPNALDALGMSKEFAGSYFVGLLVALNFIGFDAMVRRRAFTAGAVSGIVTRLASYTFTLYLAHYPLLNFWVATTNHDAHSWFDQGVLFAVVFSAVYLIGQCGEHRKSAFRRLGSWVFARLGIPISSTPGSTAKT